MKNTKVKLRVSSCFSFFLLCFLFSIKLFSQSFTDNPNVYISEGTTITDANIVTEQKTVAKIYVAEGTIVSGFKNTVIVYVKKNTINASESKTNNPKRTVLEKKKPKVVEQHIFLTHSRSKNSYTANKIFSSTAITNYHNFSKYVASHFENKFHDFQKFEGKTKGFAISHLIIIPISIRSNSIRPPPNS